MVTIRKGKLKPRIILALDWLSDIAQKKEVELTVENNVLRAEHSGPEVIVVAGSGAVARTRHEGKVVTGVAVWPRELLLCVAAVDSVPVVPTLRSRGRGISIC